MYQTDLTETQWQFIKKELKIQERKRKRVHDKLQYFSQFVSLC